nr:carboxypeptidase D-like [Lytechinus pictus]
MDSFDGSGIEGATISVQGINHDVVSVQYGNYWRLLLPDTYNITVKAEGYFSMSRDVVVTEDEVTRVDFRLRSKTRFIEPVPIVHHTQDSMIEDLTDITDRYPNITHLYSIGNSVQGRQIMAIEISDRPGVHEPGEPEMKYVAGIHGNEVVGGEMLMLLIQFLCENYETSDKVRWLVDNTRIHLVPSMNPDGKAIAFEGDQESVVGRNNHRNVDLNRNFPDRFGRSEGTIQPETKAIMDWTKKHPFVISAGLHGGSIVANYPYDSNSESQESMYSASPDDAMFKQLALAFANSHGMMYKGFPCPDAYPNEKFEGGITNGAKWYLVDGGMQDWNYVNTNTMEITVEMSCVKFPLTADLPQYWNDNKMSLLSFMHEVHRGIHGFVLDRAGKGISHAHIIVEGIEHNVSTAKYGDFWRPLTPGFYNITAHAEGYALQTQEVIVYPGPATQVNFTLVTEGSDDGQLDLPLAEWAAWYDFSIPQNFSGYQTNDDLARVLLEYQGSYPDIIDLSPLGQTRSGNSIWMVEMGKYMNMDNVIDMPRVALVGGLRGEEPVGRELLWRFIHHLGEGYHANDDRVVRLLNSTRLTIIPAIDYDGFGLAHEGDCTGSMYEGDFTPNSFGPDGELLSQRPELVALHDLFSEHNFSLVLSIESSGMWVRYPYDNPNSDHGSTTEDNMLFFEIANAYASANSILSGGVKCNGHTYGAGVVNGAEWKNTRNTLQDFLYTQKSEFMVTAQISCCKYPDHVELENLWRTNLESLLKFTEKSHQGIRGKIQTADGTPLPSAVIHHGDHTHVLIPDGDGMFRRMMPTGIHGVTASAPGYMPLTKDVHVTMNTVSEVVFEMEKEPGMTYHHYNDTTEMLKNLTASYPHLTHLKSIGVSVEGRPLQVLELSNKPGSHQPGRPEVKFIGSIHGNEPVGRELVLSLANYLLMSYGKDDAITKLLDTTHIHILPTMNPDGSEKTKALQGTCFGDEGKTNANGINLENDYQVNVMNASIDVQPETRAVTDWLSSRPFTLGVSLFGGTVVARYPYNSQKGGGNIIQTADDQLFQHLAKAYANKHPTMHLGNPQCPGNAEESYPNGIVNGAEWNAQDNNIQDFTYDFLGCLDLSIHTCCCLYPKASELQDLWKAHRPALIETIKQAHRGIQGFVTTTQTKPLEGATITISGIHRNHVVTSQHGDFWLLLPDGQYSITASAEGHSSEVIPAEVNGQEVLVINFKLPEKSTIMGFPIYLFLGMIALSFAVVLLTVVCISRCCRSKAQRARRTRGFYQLDQSRMFSEEYHDEFALKTIRNGDKKSLIKNMEFHDFSDTDSEDDETFRR